MEKELTVVDLLQLFKRRSKTILLGMLILFAFGGLFCALSPKRYLASATIEVQKQSTDGLNLDTLMGGSGGSTDALNADIDIQTQAAILQSNAIAMRTIRKLGPERFSEANGPASALKLALHIGSRNSPVGPARSEEEKVASVLRTFHASLSVKPLGGTRLIEIDYLSADPKLAAAVANQVVQELVDYGFETRFKATESASQALSKELADLQVRSEQLQGQVAQMQRDSGIYGMGTVDAQGRPQAYSAVLDQFQRAATTLSDASQNRILKKVIFEAARSGDPEMLSGLAGNSSSATSSGISNSLTAIQTLRAQQAALQGQHDQLATKFGSGYPKLAELQANIDSLEEAVHRETGRIAQRAGSDYAVADLTWKDANANYDQQKVKADALNDRAIKYIIARQEADDSRSLYEDLLKRLKEAGILQGLHSSTVAVLDQAMVPDFPSTPNVSLILAGSLVIGFLLGTGGSLLLDIMNKDIQHPDELGKMGLPMYGLLPALTRGSSAIEVWSHPDSPYSQSVHYLRALLKSAGHIPQAKVFLVTSALPGEGKSTYGINLAASLVQQGRKTLLLEAESKPIPDSKWLTSKAAPQEGTPRVHLDVPKLFLFSARQAWREDSELLDVEQLRALISGFRTQFDAIVIDGPSTLATPEVCVLSEAADATIQVVRLGTTRIAVRRAFDLLGLHSKTPVGVVLNAPEVNSKAYAEFSGYPGPPAYAQGGRV